MSNRNNFDIQTLESNYEIKQELIELVIFLDTFLPLDWEIFVHPFINSERPDLAILNKNLGAVLFQGFYETADNYSVKIKKVNSEKGSYVSKSFLFNDGDKRQTLIYPLNTLEIISENLINIYVPDIGHSARRNNAVRKLVKSVMYVPNMSSYKAEKLFSHDADYFTILTKENLNEVNYKNFYNKFLSSSPIMLEKSWYDELKFYFSPPLHQSNEGKNIKFFDNQANYAHHQSKKHQRLRGVAGSGKSLILTHRAADIASKGKKVLFLTYNITLINYIQFLLKQMPITFHYKDIVITNYHHFCSIYFRENNISWPKGDDPRQQLDYDVPEKLRQSILNGKNIRKRKYDAIIIDEVQDFKVNWLESLQLLISDNNEIVIAGDDNQDIYDRGTYQLDSFKSGFSGPWGVIKFCYRLPYKIILEVNRFAKHFMGIVENIQFYRKNNVALFDPKLFWYDLKEDNIAFVKKIYESHLENKLINNYDTVILVPNNIIGIKIKNQFTENGIEVNEIFGDRNKKLSFKFGSQHLKISTLQSFKGWEYTNIILYSPSTESKNIKNMDKLFYTAITRSTKNLIVINNNKRYFEFGKSPNWEYNLFPKLPLTS